VIRIWSKKACSVTMVMSFSSTRGIPDRIDNALSLVAKIALVSARADAFFAHISIASRMNQLVAGAQDSCGR